MRIALVLVLAVACAGEPDVPAEVTGPITSIERSDRGAIAAFTVEADGQRHVVRIDPGRDYGFDLEHLEEHRVERLPVRVTLEVREADVFAVEILDA